MSFDIRIHPENHHHIYFKIQMTSTSADPKDITVYTGGKGTFSLPGNIVQ